MYSRKTAVRLALAAVAAIGLVGTAAAQSKPPIKIGLILPYTGFASNLVPYFETGFQIGVDDVNAAGGVNGSRLEILKEDDQLRPPEAVRGYRKLARDGALTAFGPISSTAWETVVPLTEQDKLPIVNTTAQKPQIGNSKYTLRMTSHDLKMMPEGVAAFAKAEPKVKRVVIMGDIKEVATKTALDSFEREAKANGMTVLETLDFTTQTTEFSPILIKLRQLNPDAIMVSSLTAAFVALAKEMNAQRFDVPVLSNLIFWPANGINLIAPLEKNIYAMGFSTNEPSGRAAYDSYIKRYQERLANDNRVPKPANAANSVIAYEAIQLVAHIMREKGIDGSTPVERAREMIADGLQRVPAWNGSLLYFTFDDKRDAYVPSRLLKADNRRQMWVYADEPPKTN
jgi:branched-chain amino acid transport system substrate-binding protein